MPVVGSQTPATWHGSEALQTPGLPPWHAPFWQVSDCVQRSWSLHGAPSALMGLEHIPVVGSHVPASWHGSEGVQTTGVPAQEPFVQRSDCVHGSLSLHAAPLALGGLEQAPVVGSQVPGSWHWSEAVQTTGLPPRQAPLRQA